MPRRTVWCGHEWGGGFSGFRHGGVGSRGGEIRTIKRFVFLFGRFIGIVVPQPAGDHEVGAVPIACDGDVVYAALSQEHLDVGFVRLRVEVVDEKDGEVDLFSHDHGGDFGVPAHGA